MFLQIVSAIGAAWVLCGVIETPFDFYRFLRWKNANGYMTDPIYKSMCIMPLMLIENIIFGPFVLASTIDRLIRFRIISND